MCGDVRDQTSQPEGLTAEILPDQIVSCVRVVALVEEKIDDLEHRLGAHAEVGSMRKVQTDALFAQHALGSNEPLRNRRFSREECPRDLRHAETADRLQAERDARIRRQRRMATHEDHPQLVVFDCRV